MRGRLNDAEAFRLSANNKKDEMISFVSDIRRKERKYEVGEKSV